MPYTHTADIDTRQYPTSPSDTFVFCKLQKSMEEPVHNLLDDAGLNLIVEGVEGEVGGRVHDVKCSVEVVPPVRKKSVLVYIYPRVKWSEGGVNGSEAVIGGRIGLYVMSRA
jgi:hypothetical protein